MSRPVEWSLFDTEKILTFTSARKPLTSPVLCAKKGQFFEGLWVAEVAELFIACSASGRYLEFNLAPNGAWWACLFEKPRERARKQSDFSSCSSLGEVLPDSWSATLAIPKSLFSSFESPKFNVTAILHEKGEHFLSFIRLPGQLPNFHQTDGFLPLNPAEDS